MLVRPRCLLNDRPPSDSVRTLPVRHFFVVRTAQLPHILLESAPNRTLSHAEIELWPASATVPPGITGFC